MNLVNLLFNDVFLKNVFIKLFGIAFSILFALLSIVLVRQIGILKKTIGLDDKGVLTFFGLMHLAISVILVVYSLLVL